MDRIHEEHHSSLRPAFLYCYYIYMKASSPDKAIRFTDIPNIGPRMSDDFKTLGLREPKDLKGKDPYKLYVKMCAVSGSRQDPCVLDTYMAAVAFMEKGNSQPWWSYTEARKKNYPNL